MDLAAYWECDMPLPAAGGLVLSEAHRKQLEAIGRHRSTPRGIALRINIVLGAAGRA